MIVIDVLKKRVGYFWLYHRTITAYGMKVMLTGVTPLLSYLKGPEMCP